MNLQQICSLSNENLRKIRAIDRLLNTYDARLAFEVADLEEEMQVELWVKNLELINLRKWIRNKVEEEPNTRKLRVQASRLGIPGYGRMNKASLMSAVYQKEAANGTS